MRLPALPCPACTRMRSFLPAAIRARLEAVERRMAARRATIDAQDETILAHRATFAASAATKRPKGETRRG